LEPAFTFLALSGKALSTNHALGNTDLRADLHDMVCPTAPHPLSQ
jgi:hypothetical protein